jgi:hypothetical protein
MGVHHTHDILTYGVNRTVNDKSGHVNIRVTVNDIPIQVDFHEIRSGNFIITQPKRVNQKMRLGAGHTRGDMIPNDIAKAKPVR